MKVKSFFLLLMNGFKTKTLHLVVWKNINNCFAVNSLIEILNSQSYTSHEKEAATLKFSTEWQ